MPCAAQERNKYESFIPFLAKKGAEKKWDILQRMKEESTITQVKLMEEFNLTRKQVQKIIKDLREDGLVERQGSNRSGKWIVKKKM